MKRHAACCVYKITQATRARAPQNFRQRFRGSRDKQKGLPLQLDRFLCSNTSEDQKKKKKSVPEVARVVVYGFSVRILLNFETAYQMPMSEGTICYSSAKKQSQKCEQDAIFHILHANGEETTAPPGYAIAHASGLENETLRTYSDKKLF